MGTGYVRQSAAEIQDGEDIVAAPLNAEFDALVAAMHGTTGHSHDGTSGEGPPIALTTSVSGVLPIANGGTNAATAALARDSLGLTIGTNVQAFDADLTAIAALVSAADRVPYSTGVATWALATFTAAARTFVAAVDAAAQIVALGITATAAEINKLAGNAVTAADLTKLSQVTSSAAELNILDGVTSSTAELNILDGVTATTAEINKLAGTPAGLTATELGYVDGVTSAIQTQIDTKLASASYTAADVLSKLLTVDGSGSGLDADLLDGISSAGFTPRVTSTTDNAVARYDSTGGLLQDSSVTISDTGDITATSTTIGGAPTLTLFRNHNSAHVGNVDGKITFQGLATPSETIQEYGSIRVDIVDNSDTTEDGSLIFSVPVAGTATDRLTIDALGTTVTGQLLAGAGAVGTPAYSFSADGNTGFWEDQADRLSVAVAGGYVAYWNSTGYTITSSAPGVAATFGSVDAVKNLLSGGGQIDVTNTTGGSAARFSRGIASDGVCVQFHRQTTLVGSVSVTATNAAYNTSSDERLKENFSDFDAGFIIDQINMYHYDWKVGGEGYGPKAQELNEVFPIAVTPGNDLEIDDPDFIPWTYDASKLVPLLLKEIQSLRQRLDAAGL